MSPSPTLPKAGLPTWGHQVQPLTRAEVSSLLMTGAARTTWAIAAASTANGLAARLRMLAMVPSLMSRPIIPANSSFRRL